MEAIEENREEHERTGRPILYASKCDPVLQLGMNETVIAVPEQHRIVDAAFALARQMDVNITRVIGRSYVMKDGAVFRTPIGTTAPSRWSSPRSSRSPPAAASGR